MKIELNRSELELLMMAMDSWRRKLDLLHQMGVQDYDLDAGCYDYGRVVRMMNKISRANLEAIVEEAYAKDNISDPEH